MTGVPGQMIPDEAVILTPGTIDDPTAIVMALDVSAPDVTQLREEVMIQVTTSPLDSWELSYRLKFDPTLFPFSFHW